MAIAVCLILAGVYLLGGRRPVRLVDSRWRWGVRHWRVSAFFAALLLMALSLSGPGDTLARQSFSTRTAQLMGLLMIVAPLLVLGVPRARFLRAVGAWSHDHRAAPWMPLVAFTLFNGAVLLAFVPAIYQATAGPGWPRELGALAMVGAGYLFWSQVIAQPPSHCRLTHLGGAAYLLLSSVQLRILGLVLGFASASFYPVALNDQQIAAGIVMVPGVLTDLVVLTVCLYLWLGQDDGRQPRHRRQALTESS